MTARTLTLLMILVLGLAVAVVLDRPRPRPGMSALRPSLDDVRETPPLSSMLEGGTSLTLRTARGQLSLSLASSCVEIAHGCARVDAAKLGELLQVLRDMRSTRVLPEVPAAEDPEAIRLTIDAHAPLRIFGACPRAAGERRAQLGAMAFCVPSETASLLDEWVGFPLSFVDRRVVAVPARDIHRVDTSALSLVKEREGWFLGETRADDRVVEDFLGDLVAVRATGVFVLPAPVVATDRWTLTSRGAKETLLVIQKPGLGTFVQREGEPVGLAVPDEKFFYRNDLTFHDRALLAFDPYRLFKVELDDSRGHREVVRGVSADDWRALSPSSGPVEREAMDALREAAADLRALRAVAKRAGPAHGLEGSRRLTFVLSPRPTEPAGARAERLALEVGAHQKGGGCHARRAGDNTVYLLSEAQCAALDLRLP